MKGAKRVSILLIGFIVGLAVYLLGATVQYQHDQQLKYQGYTIKEWSVIADSNKKFWEASVDQASACQLDPSSIACNPLNKFLTPKSCDQTIRNTGDIVWHYRNCSVSTSATQYVPQAQQTRTQETFMQQGKYLYGSNGSFCIPINGNQWSCQ